MYNDRKDLDRRVRAFVAGNGIDLRHYAHAFAERYNGGKAIADPDAVIGHFVGAYGRPWKHGHGLPPHSADCDEATTDWIYRHELREYFETLGCFLPPERETAVDAVPKDEVGRIFVTCVKKVLKYTSILDNFGVVFSIMYWNHQPVGSEQVIIDYFTNNCFRPWKTRWVYEQEAIDFVQGMDYMYEVWANV